MQKILVANNVKATWSTKNDHAVAINKLCEEQKCLKNDKGEYIIDLDKYSASPSPAAAIENQGISTNNEDLEENFTTYFMDDPVAIPEHMLRHDSHIPLEINHMERQGILTTRAKDIQNLARDIKQIHLINRRTDRHNWRYKEIFDRFKQPPDYNTSYCGSNHYRILYHITCDNMPST